MTLSYSAAAFRSVGRVHAVYVLRYAESRPRCEFVFLSLTVLFLCWRSAYTPVTGHYPYREGLGLIAGFAAPALFNLAMKMQC